MPIDDSKDLDNIALKPKASRCVFFLLGGGVNGRGVFILFPLNQFLFREDAEALGGARRNKPGKQNSSDKLGSIEKSKHLRFAFKTIKHFF